VTEENKGHGLLTGLLIGGIIGAALTFWLVERTGQRGRQGLGVGSRASDLASYIKDEVSGKVKDLIRRTIDEGSETARRTRDDIEERLREENEV
jgi:gas vesicle protein